MLINSFFQLKFYFLNMGWIHYNFIVNELNYGVYAIFDKSKVMLLDQILLEFKKIFIMIQTILNKLGILLILSSYFYFFKSIINSCFYVREYSLHKYTSGFLSNHIYTKQIKMLPDLILVFDLKRNISLLKEIKLMGIPSIGISNSLEYTSLLEYAIFLETNCYFVNLLILISLFSVYFYFKIKIV